jgi:hypothetical protein
LVTGWVRVVGGGVEGKPTAKEITITAVEDKSSNNGYQDD